MADTTTAALADSLPTVIASARIVREYEGVMSQLADKYNLDDGTGLDWNEITYAALTATAITETTQQMNAQQLSDTKFSVTPTVIGIHTIITDRVAARISPKGYAKLGQLTGNAMARKEDEDGLIVLDGATTSGPGAGSTLTSGVISAWVSQIQGNTTEPGNPPFYAVLHPYQIMDIQSELVAGVGTYPIGEGLTARVFSEGFRGMVGGAQIYSDGNITIDGSADSKGGVFAKEAVCLVEGRKLKTETVRKPEIGGGATALYMYHEYAYGERSAGSWLKEVYSDTTAPTS